MAKNTIKIKYDKETGEFQIYFEMEEETANLREHNRKHEMIVKEFLGNDYPFEVGDKKRVDDEKLKVKEDEKEEIIEKETIKIGDK